MIDPIDMISSVAILCLMVVPGFLLSKFKLAEGKFALGLSNFVLYIGQCCMFVHSFANTKFDAKLLINFGIVFLSSAVIHLVFTGIAYLFYHGAEEGMRRILRFSTVFTNAGYMSLALFELLFPGQNEIALYASAYLIFFNMYVWSAGIMMQTNDKSYIKAKNMFLNPAVIATAIGLILFFCRSEAWINNYVPTKIINDALQILRSTVAPLSMVVVGIRLGMTNFRGFFKDSYMWFYMFVRLLLSPVIVFFMLWPVFKLLGMWITDEAANTLLAVLLVCASTPAATTASMFAEKYGADAAYAGKLVSVSTVLSVVTMPFCAILLQLL